MITNFLIAVPAESKLIDLPANVLKTINKIMVGGLYEWGLPCSRIHENKKIIAVSIDVGQSAAETLLHVRALIAADEMEWHVKAAQSFDGSEVPLPVPLDFINYLADVPSNPGERVEQVWSAPTAPHPIVTNAGNAPWAWQIT